jgi:hypothetical protein
LVEAVEDRHPVKGPSFSVEAGALLASNWRCPTPQAHGDVGGMLGLWTRRFMASLPGGVCYVAMCVGFVQPNNRGTYLHLDGACCPAMAFLDDADDGA